MADIIDDRRKVWVLVDEVLGETVRAVHVLRNGKSYFPSKQFEPRFIRWEMGWLMEIPAWLAERMGLEAVNLTEIDAWVEIQNWRDIVEEEALAGLPVGKSLNTLEAEAGPDGLPVGTQIRWRTEDFHWEKQEDGSWESSRRRERRKQDDFSSYPHFSIVHQPTTEKKMNMKQGFKFAVSNAKRNHIEGALTGATAVANRQMVNELADLVEDKSPELAALLRTDVGRVVGLSIVAFIVDGAAEAGALPDFIPTRFVQNYARRTEFATGFELSEALGNNIVEQMGGIVVGKLSELKDKTDSIMSSYGINEVEFDDEAFAELEEEVAMAAEEKSEVSR